MKHLTDTPAGVKRQKSENAKGEKQKAGPESESYPSQNDCSPLLLLRQKGQQVAQLLCAEVFETFGHEGEFALFE